MTGELARVLLATVAAENAAIYGYSVAGARLPSAAQRAVARRYYDVHRAQLDAVTSWTTARGASPPPAAPQYSLPDAAAASALLMRLEEATAACYADLVAVSDGSLRRAAALALQQAAVREAHWRGGATPFPGLVGRLPNR